MSRVRYESESIGHEPLVCGGGFLPAHRTSAVVRSVPAVLLYPSQAAQPSLLQPHIKPSYSSDMPHVVKRVRESLVVFLNACPLHRLPL
jgi:hypothetical protein